MTKKRMGGYMISKIHHLSKRIFAKKLKDYEITEINPAQGRILFALWQQDDISIQELSKKTSLSKSTLTRMLDRLEETGYIVRVFPENDRRKVLIRLTEENGKMKASYEDVSKDMTKLFYEGFSEDEVVAFEDYLLRIFTNLSMSADKTGNNTDVCH